METVGFWILFVGWALLISSALPEEWVSKLHVPWYVKVLVPFFSVITMMIGWQIYCLGNQGRWPGYPLDEIIEWFR